MYCRCCWQKYNSLCQLRTKMMSLLHSAIRSRNSSTLQSSRRRFTSKSYTMRSRKTIRSHDCRTVHAPLRALKARQHRKLKKWKSNSDQVFYHDICFCAPKMRECLLHMQAEFCSLSRVQPCDMCIYIL